MSDPTFHNSYRQTQLSAPNNQDVLKTADNIERRHRGGYPAAKGSEFEDGLSGEDEGDHPPHPLQLHLHLQLHFVELAISSAD